MPRSRGSLSPAALAATVWVSQSVSDVVPGIAKLVARTPSCFRFQGLRPGRGAVFDDAAGQASMRQRTV